jgi:hypothetical protein
MLIFPFRVGLWTACPCTWAGSPELNYMLVKKIEHCIIVLFLHGTQWTESPGCFSLEILSTSRLIRTKRKTISRVFFPFHVGFWTAGPSAWGGCPELN